MNKIELIGTNDCKVVVTPRYAGNYGWVRISGESRTPEHELALCKDIVSDIKRHVDNIEHIEIEQTKVYKYNNTEYESLYELLNCECNVNYEDTFIVHYKHEKDTCFCQGRYDFKEIIEKAYEKPYDFKCDGLSKEQQEFLDNVIKFSIKLKEEKQVYK